MTAPAQENKRGGRASRDKGNGLERAIVRLLQDHGLGAERIPLSGSAGGSFSGDVTTPLIGRDLTIECKSRANGFLNFIRGSKAATLSLSKLIGGMRSSCCPCGLPLKSRPRRKGERHEPPLRRRP